MADFCPHLSFVLAFRYYNRKQDENNLDNKKKRKEEEDQKNRNSILAKSSSPMPILSGCKKLKSNNIKCNNISSLSAKHKQEYYASGDNKHILVDSLTNNDGLEYSSNNEYCNNNKKLKLKTRNECGDLPPASSSSKLVNGSLDDGECTPMDEDHDEEIQDEAEGMDIGDHVNDHDLTNEEEIEVEEEEEENPVCDMCHPSGHCDQQQQLWQCLDLRCGLILCGKAGENHSQLHFALWDNRRPAPAIWVPPDGSDEDCPRGLYNIGNTCFMNAALQCMLSVTPLNSYFMGMCCSLSGRQVSNSYLWLLNEIWCDENTGNGGNYQKGIMPSRLLHAVRSAHPILRGCHQHDTQEFLRLFMDTLTEETRIPHFTLVENNNSSHHKKPNEGSLSSSSSSSTASDESETESFETCDSGNGSEETISLQNGAKDQSLKDVKVVMKSIVSDIFDGKVESSVQCLSCKQTSRRLEVFQDLSLPIPTKDEILALKSADKYENDEERQPRKNMYSCEKCKKLRNGVKRCLLYQLPDVLCVHLKRFRVFEYGGGMGFSGKVNQYVQFPLDYLELKPFLHQACPNQVTSYRLLGTICHMGSFTGGHCIAYIRRGDQWYVCDDSRVMPVSQEIVASSEAYVLFYQNWDEKEDVTKQNMLSEWSSKEQNYGKNERFHLLSRKWLTTFCWGDESGPIDNSDIVCPHGYFAPHEAVHLGATWVPHSVWEIIHKRYGGGPDLLYPESCAICTAALKKHQKQVQKTAKTTPEPSISLSNNSPMIRDLINSSSN